MTHYLVCHPGAGRDPFRAWIPAFAGMTLFFCLLTSAMAQEPDARTQALYRELRCVVCEGQSLADSQAELAIEMRRIVAEKIAAGESDDAIRAYFVARYGDAVLMRPPVNASTLPLWLAPLGLVAMGLFLYWRLR